MDTFYERLIVRAATIDEILSDHFVALPGQKADLDVSAQRLAAWCRSCASGDWVLFVHRLARDGLTIAEVLARFATIRRQPSAPSPAWLDDAVWIEAALQSSVKSASSMAALDRAEPCAFEELLAALVEQAEERLWSSIDRRAAANLNESARACLSLSLLKELSDFAAPAIYERFNASRKVTKNPQVATPRHSKADADHYHDFVAEMKSGGFRRLFEDRPVLLRLMAVITRQWIESSCEFVLRLDSDLAGIRREILLSNAAGPVCNIQGDLSDPHNGGRSVKIVRFEDGSRIVYKPKDVCLDAAWYGLIRQLNSAGPPTALKAACVIKRDGYGWVEFIDHAGCADSEGCRRFFRRAGAWLALFHYFAATDMHQENWIAAADHPVPIDLEMILQPSVESDQAQDAEARAAEAAADILANSVTAVGLLPAYARSPDNKVFAIGGMTSGWTGKIELKWDNINSDQMRPKRLKKMGTADPNLPHVAGRYAKFGDHIDEFVTGFEDYANFLLRQQVKRRALFDGFVGLPVRKVVRPTRFYHMLLQRLKNHQTMGDGVVWSAQADFIARMAEWEKPCDPLWPLQRAERSALIALNVPHFVSSSDGSLIGDGAGFSLRTAAQSGLARAQARVQSGDGRDIAWQIEVIRENTNSLRPASSMAQTVEAKPIMPAPVGASLANELFRAEADRIAMELSSLAIRRGPGAAWIGLDWLGDSEAFQLVCLGPDLYNGAAGIAVFLAAHSAVAGCKASGELALAAVAQLRKSLKSRNAARIARSLGVGGAVGLGSIVYALSVMSKCLVDDHLLDDARVAAELVTDDLIAADQRLDVIGGSAGAILCLLRLYRDTGSDDVLRRAEKCGEHLMRQGRIGPEGHRSWASHGLGGRPLAGMSHGAAGFGYALAALSAASGREAFAQAAAECVAFEGSQYDAERHNWPDLRGDEPSWPSQWCHGATGIGLARLATKKWGGMDAAVLTHDIRNATDGVQRGWPGRVDTLCCGTLGSIEFLCEAGSALGRSDLRDAASQHLLAVLQAAASAGDYRWNSGSRKFNLGLFRGLAGVGYTLLRRVDHVPDVLTWE
jgi:type 2 lantibiotic biosynthesis protein LanM